MTIHDLILQFLLHKQSPHTTQQHYLASLGETVRQLREAYRQEQIRVDYAAPGVAEAYLIAYFPYYIHQVWHVLRELDVVGIAPEFSTTGRACFIGAGPGPEVLGWLRYLHDYAPSTTTAHATIFDLNVEHWQHYQPVSDPAVRMHYWQGELELENVRFDLSDTERNLQQLDRAARQALQNADLVVIQNCLNDQTAEPEHLQRFLSGLLELLSDGCTLIIVDLDYVPVSALMRDIEQYAIQDNLASVLLSAANGLKEYSDTVTLSPVMQNFYRYDVGMNAREATRYYRTVLRRGKSNLQQPGLKSGNVDELQPHNPIQALQTLDILLSPGKRSHSSPLLQEAQWRTLFPNATASQPFISERLKVHAEQLRIWAAQFKEYCQTNNDLPTDLYESHSEVAAAALILHAERRVVQLQSILLDMVRHEHLPHDFSNILIATPYPGIDIAALLILCWHGVMRRRSMGMLCLYKC